VLTRSHLFLLQAIERLIADDPRLASTIELHLAGVLSDADREAAKATPVVHPHGYLSHADAVALMRSADLLFLPMHSMPPRTRARVVPGKTYEYLAAKRPILAAVPDGDAKDILLAAGNASVCDPGDVSSIADAIEIELARWRRDESPARPAGAILDRYERRALTADYAALLAALAGTLRPPCASEREAGRGAAPSGWLPSGSRR